MEGPDRQLPDALNYQRALIRHWNKRKYGASQLSFSTRERIPGENYPQFGHSPTKMFDSLALGPKNLKNTCLKERQVIGLPGASTSLGPAPCRI